MTALLPDPALLPVDVDERAAALDWETGRVWAAWAWLDKRTPAPGTLVPTPRCGSAS